MSAKEVVEGWLNSKGHRENIEGNSTYTGIGLAKASDGRIYFTPQIFLQAMIVVLFSYVQRVEVCDISKARWHTSKPGSKMLV